MSNKLYVGNLAYSVEAPDLQDLFEKFGELLDATLIKEPGGRSKGFGFVTFKEATDATTAIETLHDREFQGRKLIVSVAKDRVTTGGGPRSGGSGGGSSRPPYRGGNGGGSREGNGGGGRGGNRRDDDNRW